MASPPYTINEGAPAASDLISGFPTQEQTFRDVVESWLLAISTNQGVLRDSAMPSTLSTDQINVGDGTFSGTNNHQVLIWGDTRAGLRLENNHTEGIGRVSFYHDDTLSGGFRYDHADDKMYGIAAGNDITTMSTSGFIVGTTALIDPTGGNTGVSMSTDGLMTASRSGDVAGRFKRGASNGTVVQFYRSTSVVGVISVTTTATTYGTSSDARLKDDLRQFDAGVILDAIKVWDFRWKETGERGHGVLAQDVLPVYPEAVIRDEETGYYHVDYSKLVPVLWQEAKDMRAELADLKRRLALLEG